MKQVNSIHMTLMKTGKKNKGGNTDKSNENSVWILFLLC